jgi:RNA polymerase sigma-70 factor, ECF subfamily
MTTALPLASRADEPGPGPAPAACDDADLVRASAAGNAESFSALVRTHHARVFNFLYQMTRHRQDAEDLTQHTFIKAYQKLGQFDLQRPLINWLLTIARHSALNHFRDRKPWSELPYDAAGREPSPARTAEIRERIANVWDRARAILSPREFEVLWLRFAEELSTEETAQVVGLTQTHVKVLVFRARQALLKGGDES